MGQTLLQSGRSGSLSIDVSAAGNYLAALAMAGFILLLYAPVLASLVQQWWTDPNYGYCFFVPPLSAWIFWRERKRWSAARHRPSILGLWIVLLAMGLLIAGTLGAERFTARISFLVLLSGIVVFLAGREKFRLAGFSLAYLFFMVPLPAIILYQLTLPLQLVASRFGAYGLNALGVHTMREGNLLLLPNCTLEVLESCSGIRSLLSLSAAVTAYAYLAKRALWRRCALVVLVVPAVIVCNGLRMVAAGLLSYRAGPQADSGFTHLGLGIGTFLLAFLMLALADAGLGFCTLRQTPRVSN
jgi:exosortase